MHWKYKIYIFNTKKKLSVPFQNKSNEIPDKRGQEVHNKQNR